MDTENLISKYLSNSVTEEEKCLLLQRLEEDETDRMKFCDLYDLWLSSNALLTGDEELEAALARFKGRISERQNNALSVNYLRVYMMRIAVSVLLLFSAGYAGYLIRDRQATDIAINRLLTGADGKGEYVLPDGSKVWLNANSILEYPELFTDGRRVVNLEGEALFEVARDTNKPFFVQSGGLEVEVSGTRFLVTNYRNKPLLETMLVNGSVKIGGDYFSSPQVLRPGQLITYNKNTGVSEISMVNTDDYTNWIHSKLVFDKANLANVIINLEKWYGVEIVASPELTRNIHMSFTIRRESLDEVLKYMSMTAPVSYKWERDTLFLSLKK